MLACDGAGGASLVITPRFTRGRMTAMFPYIYDLPALRYQLHVCLWSNRWRLLVATILRLGPSWRLIAGHGASQVAIVSRGLPPFCSNTTRNPINLAETSELEEHGKYLKTKKRTNQPHTLIHTYYVETLGSLETLL